jgi:hypothetical protein
MSKDLDLKNAQMLAFLHRPRKRRKTPRERLAERLTEAGYHVAPTQIHGVKGFWRIEQRYDDQMVCWEATVHLHPLDWPFSINLYSYDTMTDCASRGITIGKFERNENVCWVHANPKKAPKQDP